VDGKPGVELGSISRCIAWSQWTSHCGEILGSGIDLCDALSGRIARLGVDGIGRQSMLSWNPTGVAYASAGGDNTLECGTPSGDASGRDWSFPRSHGGIYHRGRTRSSDPPSSPNWVSVETTTAVENLTPAEFRQQS